MFLVLVEYLTGDSKPVAGKCRPRKLRLLGKVDAVLAGQQHAHQARKEGCQVRPVHDSLGEGRTRHHVTGIVVPRKLRERVHVRRFHADVERHLFIETNRFEAALQGDWA